MIDTPSPGSIIGIDCPLDAFPVWSSAYQKNNVRDSLGVIAKLEPCLVLSTIVNSHRRGNNEWVLSILVSYSKGIAWVHILCTEFMTTFIRTFYVGPENGRS